MRTTALLLFTALAATACAETTAKNQESKTAERTVTVRVEALASRPIAERLRWTALTAANAEVQLTFKGSGRVRKLHFEEGSVVRAGDLLGTLVEEDYWSYRKLARIQVKTLEPDARRLQSLAEQEALPQAEADRMRGKVNVARAQLAQADAALSGVFLRAPIDGVIEKKAVSEGDLVSPAREVGRLLDLSQVRVVVHASDTELAVLTPGAKVELELPDPPRRTTGTVDRVSPLADFKTRTFPVTILVKNELVDGRPVLRSGLKVVVTLELPGNATLRVPFSAVLRAEDRRNYVYLVREGHAALVFVKPGRLIHGRLEILEGLAPGDVLVVSGQQFLREGTPLSIRE
jgi:membrane fusion protein (multidrug efflux system)